MQLEEGDYRCDKLCNKLPAVAARRSVHGYAPEAALSMPGCAGDQKLLRVNRVLQRQPGKLQVDTGVQAA